MKWRAAVVAVSVLAITAATGCSEQAARDADVTPSSSLQTREWRKPIVATTSNRDVLSYMAGPSGSFQVIDGCLAFVDVSGQTSTPVFGDRGGGPVPQRDGVIWGKRKFHYGEKVRGSGGAAPRDLEINEVARQNCPEPYLVIGSISPRSKQELEEMQARRTPTRPKSD